MKKFGWTTWYALYSKFKLSGLSSIERYGLRYLHSRYALNELAYSVSKVLQASKKNCLISVDSIWIDGTPQAIAQLKDGATVQCELADLLFLLVEKDSSGKVFKETGLLVQAKATPKYNKLTSGSSTKKERQMLEGMDRSKPIELFKDTKCSPGALIGSYILGGIPCGLEDCSRYLLMPKLAKWLSPSYTRIAPFQVGWPYSRHSPYLEKPRGVVEAVQRMAVIGDIGKEVIEPSTCEWSRLVNDLRGKYVKTDMRGYGGQSRINTSGEIVFLSSSCFPTDLPYFKPPHIPPTNTEKAENSDEFTSPSISILEVSVVHLEQ